MSPLHPDAVWRKATQKWAEIEANSPDLAAPVALQQRLLRLILEASSSLDDTLTLHLTAEAIADKWSRGVPAVRNETVPIPPILQSILPRLCAVLAEGGAGESARHIGSAIAHRNIDAGSLLGVSLARNQSAIRSSALHMGFSPDLLWLIGELGSSPLAHHLADNLFARHLSVGLEASTTTDMHGQDGRRADLPPSRDASADHRSVGEDGQVGSTDWDRGYCPFCGSWPVLIERIDDAGVLRCSYCALGWLLRTRRCIYCGNAGDDFVAAAPDTTRPGKRVELCGACGGYTKVIDVDAATPFPLLAIEDLATMNLDRGAMDRGYRRPALIDLDAIAPTKSTC